jgi:hypothetical protein
MTGRIASRFGVALALVMAGVAGCGHSGPVAGKALAQQACLGSGAQAAADAAQAARLNSAYSTLAADEAALAANESQQQSELSDGSGGDGGLGGLTTSTAIGTTGGIKVITDCVQLGLSVTHH